MVDPWVYAAYMKADAIHPDYRVALGCPGLIQGCREAGIAINAWTVNEPDAAQLLAQANVNAIITNRPDEVLRAIGR